MATDCPSAFDYTQQVDQHSMVNTPPTYAIYLAGLVFAWIKAQGGVTAMAARNAEKAAWLYGTIDRSSLSTAIVSIRLPGRA